MARQAKRSAGASDRWKALCMKAGDTVARQMEGCEQRIARAVVDLSQSQATFATSLVFSCNADGELKLVVKSREPTLRIDPVEIKLSSSNGQLGLFDGPAAKKPDPNADSGKEE